MYKNYYGKIVTEEELSLMSPYELGETGMAEAIPHLKKYLISSLYDDKRLAASAITKLVTTFERNCQSLKDLLMQNFRDNTGQVRQYTLKALNTLYLSREDLTEIYHYSNTSDKEYNLVIARKILKERSFLK